MKFNPSRRKFIEKTIKTGSMIPLSGFGAYSLTPFSANRHVPCIHCGYRRSETLSINFLRDKFCPGCGLNILSNNFSISSKCTCTEMKKQGFVEGKKAPCLAVPFPTDGVAKQLDKPSLNLASLKF